MGRGTTNMTFSTRGSVMPFARKRSTMRSRTRSEVSVCAVLSATFGAPFFVATDAALRSRSGARGTLRSWMAREGDADDEGAPR